MLQRTHVAQAGLLETVRTLVAWNKGNAAARLAAKPSSDTPPAQLSASELERIKQTVTRGGTSCAAPHTPRDHRDTSVDSEAFCSEALLPGLETVVLARRSTKVFDETRPVDKALIQRLLTTTLRSPSANNLQAWHAIVIDAEAQKQALCRAALGQRQVVTAPYTIVFAGDTEGERYAPQALEQALENGSFGANYGPAYLRSVYYHLHGGPLQSMALAKNVLSRWYSRQTDTPLLSIPVSTCGYAWKQTMIPATTFLYLATAAGLDTCIMEGIDEEAVKRVVGLPDRFTVPVLISVGHAAPGDGYGGPRRPKTGRFSVNHMVRWGKY